ncbi:MAG: MBL fold metallo-hydrolase [Limnochordaceae bacterium]|nr:MBL fold metallo-hydrolase [Limnochordaceae bacterium]
MGRLRWFVWFGAFVSAMVTPRAWAAEPASIPVSLTYLGHSAFLLEAGGQRWVTDPFSPGMGYPDLHLQADGVTVSHEHTDHNFVQAITGHPQVVRGLDARGNWQPVRLQEGPWSIRTVPTYHDGEQGKQRGKNSVFVFIVGGLHIVHLGDLGHLLTPAQVQEIGPVDVLLIPVGGHFTIDAGQAAEVVAQLHPKVIIPMHFNNGLPAMRSWPIQGVAPFLEAMKAKALIHQGVGPTVTLEYSRLPAKPEVWVMKWVGQR